MSYNLNSFEGGSQGVQGGAALPGWPGNKYWAVIGQYCQCSPLIGQEDVESPLPSNIVQPVRRRGAISAEPINEEDAATYIKKVAIDKYRIQTF